MSIRACALQSEAFAALKAAYDDRDAAAKAWRAAGRKVLGKVGFDVPDELVMAAGMLPVQVYADPAKPLIQTDTYLEHAFEPVVRAQFERLVDGTYSDLTDYIAISNSTDIVIRIYLYLRELKRVEPDKKIPPIAFIDWLFTRHRLHQTRDEFVISLFKHQLEQWCGYAITDDQIRAAGKICNENREALRLALENAAKFDRKILVEEFINGHEVEVAVLGNDAPAASVCGEIDSGTEFYDYDAKYISDCARLYIPARIDEETAERVREAAVKVYQAMGCRGLSRVDFFVTYDKNEVVFNEINTIPGFTSISMYPKLFGASGIPYSELLDRLLELAVEACT